VPDTPKRQTRRARPQEGEGPDAKQPTFEQALARLEEIASGLEGGDLPLEQAIAMAEEGQRLVQLCEKHLTEAAGRIQQLVERAGMVSLEPLDGEEAEAEQEG
jgi:exodeoxyribonuclease VII small subunit